MDKISIFILAVLYLIAGVSYLFIEIKYIRRKNEIQLISITKFMYCFVYGFIPALLFFRENIGVDTIGNLDLSGEGVVELYAIFFLSLVGYFLLNLGYKAKTIWRIIRRNEDEGSTIKMGLSRYHNQIVITVILFTIVGWLSLYLWTKAYGSIWVFIQNANRIRSGYGTVSNSLAFFKEFARIITIAFYGSVALFLYENKGIRKFFAFLLMAISFYGCILFTMASDSRTSVAATLIGSVLLIIDFNIKDRGKRVLQQVVMLFVIFVIAYEGLILSESVMNSLRVGSSVQLEKVDVFSSIEIEFRHLVQSQQTVLKMFFDGILDYKLLDDLYNTMFCWIPSRFHPSNMPSTVWQYNTSNLSFSSGILPTDILSTGIYHMGIIGAFILPFLYGRIILIVERMAYMKRRGLIECAIYYNIITICLINISHFQYSNIIQRLFPVFMAICIYTAVKILFGKPRR